MTAWLPLLCRGVVALMLVAAAVLKLLHYGDRVTSFASHGIPVPEIMVLLVAVVELASAVSIGFGIVARLGALVILPVMVTAMVTVGVAPPNVIVLVGCLVIVVVGPGSYALFQPDLGIRNRFGGGSASG